jgi:DNA mismatch repair protein MutS2
VLNVNDIRLKTSFNKLVFTEQRPVSMLKFRSKNRSRNIINEINEKAANFSLSIDLRGKRVEEAMPILQRYIDEAILLSMSEVSILHGKGDGILRPIVREYLQSIEEVKRFGDAPLDMGGAGITKVYFR